MNKSRNFWIVIGFILIAWLCIGLTDFIFVSQAKEPVFCVETKTNHYTGLGYSFDIYHHPVTGELNCQAYIFTFKVEGLFEGINTPSDGESIVEVVTPGGGWN